MRGLGWRSDFQERTWAEVREFEAGVWRGKPEGLHLLAIIDSVVAANATSALAVTTSMHDLVVVTRPIPEPPMDVLVVSAPGSLHKPPAGLVRIEYLSVMGRNTTIDRPSDEAVRLFWRFVREEFGMSVSA